MAFADLNDRERNIVRDCLRAAVEGQFFPDWEFHALFGLTRDQVKDVLEAWPKLDDESELVKLAINNSLVNLLGYPHSNKAEWSRFISVPDEEVARTLSKWKGEKAGRYFDELM